MARRNHGNRKVGFQRFFEGLSKNIKAETKKALLEGAMLIVHEAEARCPVSEDTKQSQYPGALRDSIKAVPNKSGTRVRITADAKNPKTGVPYGQYVEFWPERRHPFMYPSMDAKRDEVLALIVDAIGEAIEKT